MKLLYSSKDNLVWLNTWNERSKTLAKPYVDTYLQAPPDWLLDPISGIMNTSPGPACFPLKQFMNEMLVNIFFHIKIKLRGIVYQNFL